MKIDLLGRYIPRENLGITQEHFRNEIIDKSVIDLRDLGMHVQ